MRRISFLFFLMLLLSPGAADLCSTQQPFGSGSEGKEWQVDLGSSQFWPRHWDRGFPHHRCERARGHQIHLSQIEERVLKPEEANTILGIIKDDFLVNDDTPGECWHDFPAVVMDTSGNFVICWDDQRNGWDNPDIYAQRYGSSGDPLGANFRVNDDAGSSGQFWPSIAKDADGDFVICWHDSRHGNPDIYAQRYSSSGDPLGTNFRVSDDTGTSKQYSPSIAMNTDGEFVICWRDYRNGEENPDIYAQRYSSSGDTLGANFRVNDDAGTSDQGPPSISIGAAGDFVICWGDNRNGDSDIWAQRYYSDGALLGTNYIVNQRPDVCWPVRGEPSVALSDDRVTFAWMDARRSVCWYIYWDIYAKVVTWDWDKADEPGDNDLGLPKDYALFQNMNINLAHSHYHSQCGWPNGQTSMDKMLKNVCLVIPTV